MHDPANRPTEIPCLFAPDERVSPPPPRLLLLITGERVEPLPLPPEGELLIGRGAEAAVPLVDPAVSRRHARLVLSPEAAQLIDLSSNGTFVNGERVLTPRPLRDGDCVRVGGVTMVLLAGRAPPAPAGEAAEAAQVLQIGRRRAVLADPAMRQLYALLEQLADKALPVLILGETGAGKDLVAEALHVLSQRRAGRPFVSQNCATLSESLVESQLFGHEPGAFTGATRTLVGVMEQAHQGTLFLDEIGELPLPVQAKLLRVLETRRLRRLGGEQERDASFRLVAATNRDLEAEVKAGRFREDLYFRINTKILRLPPLRERRGEIPHLARAFLAEFCQQGGRAPMTLSAAALGCLWRHPWPGNVRQLRNAMEEIAALCPHDEVGLADLPAWLRQVGQADGGAPRPLLTEVQELERRRISEAMKQTGGVVSQAARLLQVPERTLYDKIKRYNLRDQGSE